MSNQWCHLCGGLVDLIGLQPRDVRLCDCKSSRDALRAENERLKADLRQAGKWLADNGALQTKIHKEREALRARITALESWLSEHGQHLSGCRYGEQRPDAECTCGLEALIDG